MQLQPDVITWRIVVSVLATFCMILTGMVYKSFSDRFDRMERKINGIIRFLIAHSENGEKEDLAKLVEE